MADVADVFVALPGGIGTLDELVEMLTLNDLGLQDKPVILCASDDFWRPFVALMDGLRAYGTLRPGAERRLRVAPTLEAAMDLVEEHFRLLASRPGGTAIRHRV
jgi:hypothetical protein